VNEPTNQNPSLKDGDENTSEPGTAPPVEPVMPDADPDALRAEVRRLRDENAATRQRAKRADSLAARLVTAHAAATGRLADPDDLPYDPALLDEDGLPDPERVTAAVDDLLNRKPHLASRTPRGDISQGVQPDDGEVDLAGLLRVGAG